MSDKENLISQWQTCVEMANSVSQRRDVMNNVFVTLNLAIITATTVGLNYKSLLIISGGLIICILWILLIRNYKILNDAKFKIITSLEKEIGCLRPFTQEWELLQKNKKYKNGTSLEKCLPGIFIVIYFVIAIIIITKGEI